MKTNLPSKVAASMLAVLMLADTAAWAAPDPSSISPKIPAPTPIAASTDLQWAHAVLPELPGSVAQIEDAWRGGEKTVLLVQDAHTNDSSQFNQAALLDILYKGMGDRLSRRIFLEAGAGDESLAFLDLSTDAAAALKRLVRQAGLQGTEYWNLTNGQDVALWGVEDMGLYAQSVELFRGIAKERDRFLPQIAQMEAAASALQERVFSPALLDVDRARQRHQDGTLTAAAYARQLAGEAQRLNLGFLHPHIDLLLELERSESGLDFEAVRHELEAAVSGLSAEDRLSIGSLETLWAPARVEDQRAFLSLIEEKVPALETFPNLKRYAEYVRRTGAIDARGVFDELARLESGVFAALASTAVQKNLVEASKGLRLLRSLAQLQMDPDSYAEYRTGRETYRPARIAGALNLQIAKADGPYERALVLDPGFEAWIAQCEAFYELTERRDRAFLDRMNEQDPVADFRILVAGGFHAKNLKRILQAEGISYISIVPGVFHPTDAARYEKILLNQHFPSSWPVAAAAGPAAAANMPMRVLWNDLSGGTAGTDLSQTLASSGRPAAAVLAQIQSRGAELADEEQKTGGARMSEFMSILKEYMDKIKMSEQDRAHVLVYTKQGYHPLSMKTVLESMTTKGWSLNEALARADELIAIIGPADSVVEDPFKEFGNYIHRVLDGSEPIGFYREVYRVAREFGKNPSTLIYLAQKRNISPEEAAHLFNPEWIQFLPSQSSTFGPEYRKVFFKLVEDALAGNLLFRDIVELKSFEKLAVDPDGRLAAQGIRMFRYPMLNERADQESIRQLGRRLPGFCLSVQVPELKLMFIDNSILRVLVDRMHAWPDRPEFGSEAWIGQVVLNPFFARIFGGPTDSDFGLRIRRTAAWQKKNPTADKYWRMWYLKNGVVSLGERKPLTKEQKQKKKATGKAAAIKNGWIKARRLAPEGALESAPKAFNESSDDERAHPVLDFLTSHRLSFDDVKTTIVLPAIKRLAQHMEVLDENELEFRVGLGINLSEPIQMEGSNIYLDRSLLTLTPDELAELVEYSIRHMMLERATVAPDAVSAEMAAYYENAFQLLTNPTDRSVNLLISALKKLGKSGWSVKAHQGFLSAVKATRKHPAYNAYQWESAEKDRHAGSIFNSYSKWDVLFKTQQALRSAMIRGLSDAGSSLQEETAQRLKPSETGSRMAVKLHVLPLRQEVFAVKQIYPDANEATIVRLLTAHPSFLYAARFYGWSTALATLQFYDAPAALQDLEKGDHSWIYQALVGSENVPAIGQWALTLRQAAGGLAWISRWIGPEGLRIVMDGRSLQENISFFNQMGVDHKRLEERPRPSYHSVMSEEIKRSDFTKADRSKMSDFDTDLFDLVKIVEGYSFNPHSLPKVHTGESAVLPGRVEPMAIRLLDQICIRYGMKLAMGLDPQAGLSNPDRTVILDTIGFAPRAFLKSAAEAESKAMAGDDSLLMDLLLLREEMSDPGSDAFLSYMQDRVLKKFQTVGAARPGSGQEILPEHVGFRWLAKLSANPDIRAKISAGLSAALEHATSQMGMSGEIIIRSLQAGARPNNYVKLLRALVYQDIFKAVPAVANQRAQELMELLQTHDAAEKRKIIQAIIASQEDLQTFMKGCNRLQTPLKQFMVAELPETWIAQNLKDLDPPTLQNLFSGLEQDLVHRISHQMPKTNRRSMILKVRDTYQRMRSEYPSEIPNLYTREEVQNHFAVLGVPLNATQDVIAESYRRLAVVFHPDTYTGEKQSVKDDAVVTFKEIALAGEVLMDAAKYAKYRREINATVEFFPKKPWYSGLPNAEDLAPQVAEVLPPISRDRALVPTSERVRDFMNRLRVFHRAAGSSADIQRELSVILESLGTVSPATLLVLTEAAGSTQDTSTLLSDTASFGLTKLVELYPNDFRDLLIHPNPVVRAAALNAVRRAPTSKATWAAAAAKMQRHPSAQERANGVRLLSEIALQIDIERPLAILLLKQIAKRETVAANQELISQTLQNLEGSGARLAAGRESETDALGLLLNMYAQRQIRDSDFELPFGAAVYGARIAANGEQTDLTLFGNDGRTIASLADAAGAAQALRFVQTETGAPSNRKIAARIRAAAHQLDQLLPEEDYLQTGGAVEIDFSNLAASLKAGEVNPAEATDAVRSLLLAASQERGRFYLSHTEHPYFQTLDGFDLQAEVREAQAFYPNRGQILFRRPAGKTIAKLHFDTGSESVRVALGPDQVAAHTTGFTDGQVPDFRTALRLAQEEAKFYAAHRRQKGAAGPEALAELLSSLRVSRFFTALKALALDGRALDAAKAHDLMTSRNPDRQELRMVLLRPLTRWIEDRAAALKLLSQTQQSA